MSKTSVFDPVKPNVNIPELEESILAFWDKEQIFEKSLEQNQSAKTYSFYDGPPFATGLPHYGHIMAGVLKDIVPRYWTMKGYKVPRRFGWDCHGLPVEYEINKKLKIESSKDVLKMGVDRYNAECRSIVDRYTGEWKKTVRRFGRWVDMDHAYFTMDVSFMQSVWWVFSEMFKKGLIYEGHKVVPYSTGVSTALSNFEANLNYKEVQDPAVTVTFPVDGKENLSLLAWTTTPWTLPSNLGLAVGRDIDYVKVKDLKSNHHYIFAKALLNSVYKNPESEVEIEETLKGKDLLGLTYTPLFNYFENLKNEGAFKVIHSDHVTTESGTGIVHMAPAFGEEDYYACKDNGVPLVNPVDDDGMFTSEVKDYEGLRVKEADKKIIKDLKTKERLFKQDTIVHSYPFCWRSDTPLIYKAVSSWFVAVEKIKDQIVANNQTTHWVPDHLKDGRFGKWLENARDWAISRNRFWGTPLPIWKNEEGEIICISSREELEKLSDQKVTDLHIEFVDKITIPSQKGGSPLKRVEGVLDCWFESGSMPYAQWGYPFTNQKQCEAGFPADFIAEGLDQTRGWFYTLMVIGTALFNKAPFKNVIVNGMILAEDGKKMSKSLRNYPDPMEVLNTHGADALRLYLIDSPVVRAQEIRFSETGVREIVRRISLRWWNAYSFFVNYANVDEFKPKHDAHKTPNILDQWILSRLHSLIDVTQKEMADYKLYNVVPALLSFIEDLTNTYIRFNRSHFWQNGMPEDKRLAYETLYEVLFNLSKIMAPFAPFLSEVVYQNLSQLNPNAKQSVHLESFPESNSKFIHSELELAVKTMDALVALGRNQREKISVKAKIPLLKMKVIHREKKVLENLKKFEPYFKDELNIREIEYISDEDQYISISAKANFPLLGKRLGPKMKAVSQAIAKLSLKELLEIESGKPLTLEGESISMDEIEIRRAPKDGNPNLATHQLVSIELDPTVHADQKQEGLAREIIRKVQAARKSADFILDDRIELQLNCSGELEKAARAHEKLICRETLTESLKWEKSPSGKHTEETEIEGDTLKLGVTALLRK